MNSSGFRAVVLALCAGGVFVFSCAREETRNVTGPGSGPGLFANVCAENTDETMETSYDPKPCPPAEDGFDDEQVNVGYVHVSNWECGQLQDKWYVIANWAARFGKNGDTASVRYLGAGGPARCQPDPICSSIGARKCWSVSKNFLLEYIEESPGVAFQGIVGVCDDSLTAQDCWDSRDTSQDHVEPWYCIDNPLDEGFSTGGDVCTASAEVFPERDGLDEPPVAEFAFTELDRTPTSATYRFSEFVLGREPPQENLEEFYEIGANAGAPDSLPGDTVEHTFTSSGTHTVRFVVKDQAGVYDADRKEITVAFAAGAVEVSPSSATLDVDDTVQLTAVVRDGYGDELPVYEVTWASSNPSVVTVDSDGLVTAVAAGEDTITATADTVVGYSIIQVNGPPPDPLSATIEGPQEVCQGTLTLWESSVLGGTPSYTYQWSGFGSGTDPYIWATLESKTGSLYLTVTDDNGQQAADTLLVLGLFDPSCGS